MSPLLFYCPYDTVTYTGRFAYNHMNRSVSRLEKFSIVKKGYNPTEVDTYVETLEQVIKSYKDKDNAIKNALISAQVAADNVVKNAHLQAVEYKQQIGKQLAFVQESIAAQRQKIQAFQEMYRTMMQEYLKDMTDKDIKPLYGRLDEIDNLIVRLKDMDDIQPESTPEAN